MNRISDADAPAHDWYRFVLSFPPHLVREYLEKFRVNSAHVVLDPFCGTGTTLVECKKNGIPSVGIEANPMAGFATEVKVNWKVRPDALLSHALKISVETASKLESDGISDAGLPLFPMKIKVRKNLKTLPEEAMKLLLTDSISPHPLHKILTLLETIYENRLEIITDHELLALAKTAVFSASNLAFGPEVGLGRKKEDAPVIFEWTQEMRRKAEHLKELRQWRDVPATVYHADAREIPRVRPAQSVDFVITSPPYPNEKDYTRTTRLESVLLGFIHDRKELQALKKNLVRSNTRGVYKGDADDKWIENFPEIHRIAEEIEAKRIRMGKTSGFERMYARVTRLYFGGMARHLSEMREVLRPGARLAYVVGDQESYLRVMIPTGELLAKIAQSLGYRLISIDLFRKRLSTATRRYLKEEVVVLQWP